MTTQVTMLPVHTVAPALKMGEIPLSADRRGKTLKDSERIRRVVLPVDYWGTLAGASNGTHYQGLTDLLRSALRQLGSDRLRDSLDTDTLLRAVPASDYSVAALLAWSEETAASRGSLVVGKDQILEWLPTSKVLAAMKAKSDRHAATITERLALLGVKNHGLKKPEEADKLAVLLADDAETEVGAALIGRLAHISKALAAKTADALSVEDL